MAEVCFVECSLRLLRESVMTLIFFENFLWRCSAHLMWNYYYLFYYHVIIVFLFESILESFDTNAKKSEIFSFNCTNKKHLKKILLKALECKQKTCASEFASHVVKWKARKFLRTWKEAKIFLLICISFSFISEIFVSENMSFLFSFVFRRDSFVYSTTNVRVSTK